MKEIVVITRPCIDSLPNSIVLTRRLCRFPFYSVACLGIRPMQQIKQQMKQIVVITRSCIASLRCLTR